MSTPTVSVLITSFNRGPILAETVRDLARQSLQPEELIVVDQSVGPEGQPVDQSALLAHPRLRYFCGHEPHAQKARNFAIREARGDILVLVDDDMRLPEGLLEAHVVNYRGGKAIHGVAGQVLKPGQAATSEVPQRALRSPDGWMLFPLHYSQRRAATNWPSCNGSILRSVAIRAGGFDENFSKTLFDDSDFSCRLRSIGARIVFDPLASAIHLKVPSGGKRPGALNSLVLADASYWATVLYFWRKNFGLWGARHQVRFALQRVFARKAFSRAPSGFFVAIRELVAGWRESTRLLRSGPALPWPVTPIGTPAGHLPD